MSKELAKAYEPQEVEGRIYDFWMQGGYFHAEVDPKKKPYTIVIPPPNITGQLHLGHAWDETLQDILIRWKRMQGYSALWLPGTDHASIATEAKIVEAMREEGLSKEDLGREAFLERAWAWKDKFGGRILEQLKLLGSSCDWDRLRFTMDEGCSKAVRHVFVKLYEEGLIVAPWPEYEEGRAFPQAEAEMKKVMELITAVRTRRSEMNVPPSKKAHLAIEAADTAAFEAEKEAIARLAYCSGVEVAQSVPQAEGSVTVVTAACRAYLPMDDLVDKKAETARLTKELEGAKKQLATAEAKLQNEKFISKAPQNVIDGVKDNAEKLREKVRGIEEALAALQ